MTIKDASVAFLKKSKKDVITQVEFLRAISKITNTTTESVRGTMMGIADYKIMQDDYVSKRWIHARSPARFIRRGTKYEAMYTNAKVVYNTKAKKQARSRILKHIPSKRNPTILTLASSEGYCVQDILKRFKTPNIINVEKDRNVLNKWEQKNIPTVNYLCDLTKFISSPKFKSMNIDFANLDLMGYASLKSHGQFTQLNEMKNCNTIAITLQYLKRFRNHGRFVDWAKLMYGHYEDPTLKWITNVFSNYNMIDTFTYNRDKKNKGMPMRVFIFKVK